MSIGRALFLADAVLMLVLWPVLLRLGCWGHECFRESADGFAAILYPIDNLICLYALGLYRREALIDTRESLARVPLAISLAAVGTAILLELIGHFLGFMPVNRVRLFAGAVMGFGVAGVVARLFISVLKRLGVFHRRVLIVGAGGRAWDLVKLLRSEGRYSQYEIACVHSPLFGEPDAELYLARSPTLTISENPDILEVANAFNPDQIVVAPDERRGMPLDTLLSCKKEGYPIVQYLSFLETEIRRVDVARIEVGWLLYSRGFHFGVIDNALKRLLDVTASLVLLVLFAPFLISAAIAFKLDDGGPILYRQERLTRNERPFKIYKLRTMRVDAEKAGPVWASTADPRITRTGDFLRKTRIDEMPQLLNVLRGDMSLVGPRPERPNFVVQLAEHMPLYHERHMVKAGLTGWAQINYPYGATIEDARAKLSYDLFYVKNFSIAFDVLILLQTLRVVLWQSGAR